jgi:hypothetical protein
MTNPLVPDGFKIEVPPQCVVYTVFKAPWQ